MYESNSKAQEPDKMGRQYNDGPTTPLSVSRDQWGNEIAEDRPMHENITPGEGSCNFSGNQYSTDFSSYGVGVEDRGKPQTESMTVDVSRADRGKEA